MSGADRSNAAARQWLTWWTGRCTTPEVAPALSFSACTTSNAMSVTDMGNAPTREQADVGERKVRLAS